MCLSTLSKSEWSRRAGPCWLVLVALYMDVEICCGCRMHMCQQLIFSVQATECSLTANFPQLVDPTGSALTHRLKDNNINNRHLCIDSRIITESISLILTLQMARGTPIIWHPSSFFVPSLSQSFKIEYFNTSKTSSLR